MASSLAGGASAEGTDAPLWAAVGLAAEEGAADVEADGEVEEPASEAGIMMGEGGQVVRRAGAGGS